MNTAVRAFRPNSRIVSEEELEKALDWLRDSAAEMGKAKERHVKAQKMSDHTEAILTLKSDQTSDTKRRAEARASARYLECIVEEAEAAGELAKMQALREAAALKIETWRSEQANFRALKI
jgi:rhamnose utilization protein RhaD (predicted bifunctional aldolase and dehydrogenase)